MYKQLSMARQWRSSSITDSAARRGRDLYVEKKIFDKVVDGVAENAKKIKMGPGLDPSTNMGPLVSQEQMDRVCGFIDSGVSEGARAMSGGKRFGDSGYFVEPTVLVGAARNAKVVQEEIFGPVVTAMPFTDMNDIGATSERFHVWVGCGNLDQRHFQSPSASVETESGHGLD